MAARRGAARALEHQLPAHELAIILADRAVGRSEAGVRGKGARGPFPDVAEQAVAGSRRYSARLVELVAKIGIGRSGEALPFGFGRKPRAGPARERVGFVKTDVGDRGGPIDLASPAKRELGPVVAPVERTGDAFLPHPGPAVRQPQGRRRIAAVVDEFAPFAVGDAPSGELMAREEDAVARPLAVEGEAVAVLRRRTRRSRQSPRGRGAKPAAPAKLAGGGNSP